ncbi:MAG: efflux RND transporter periplasmic adaptor subunit [bacterium]|nr:efflux RND transporter periplasmic adaptor subunit [bacterium]
MQRSAVWMALCAGVSSAPSAQGQFGGPAKVTVAEVELRPLPASATLVGTVRPLTRSVIGSEIAGLVEQMPAREGDFIRKGELLCKLRGDTIEFELAEARARHKALEAELRRWEYELERIKRLYGGEDASAKEVYDAQASHDEAKYSAAAQGEVVGRLESDLTKTEIRAPFDGSVVQRFTEIGQWLNQGGDVVDLAILSSVLVRVDVPESALPYMKVGQPGSVLIEALGRRFEGRIRHVILQADPTARTFPVTVQVTNPGYQARAADALADSGDKSATPTEETQGRPGDRSDSTGRHQGPEQPDLLAGGMFARVTLAVGPAVEVPAIPKDAVVTRDGVDYAAMVTPGREEGSLMAIPMPITTGADIGDWIAVTSGNLGPGMRVVTRGNENIMFPSPIVIVEYGNEPPKTTAAAEPGSTKPGSSKAGS